MPAFDASAESSRPSPEALVEADRWLRQGMPVVIPTETVYGLAARALDAEAVARIFAIKGRPHDNPLIVHVTREQHLSDVGARLSALGRRLARAFWPGPLTLVVSAEKSLPWVTAGLDSVAVRHPAHVFAAALIERTGPLAAPSANLSGRPSPTRAEHAAVDLAGRVPLVVDGGSLEHGLESTVVDVRDERALLLRPGALSVEMLEAEAGVPVQVNADGEVVRSPGMKYRHYSPRAELWLYCQGESMESANARLRADVRELAASGRRVGVIARGPRTGDHHVALPAELPELGRRLFAWLREMDERGMDYVLIEGVDDRGVGRAVMDRLRRAATRLMDTGTPPSTPAEKSS